MKLILLPLIFIGIYFANSSKLAQSACKIVGEVVEEENWMKTIAILDFNDNFQEIDNLAKCLPSEITVVMIDAMTYDTDLETIHNFDYVIILIDEFDMKKLSVLFPFVYDLVMKPILNHNLKYLVITSNLDTRIIRQTLKKLDEHLSILNSAIIFEVDGEVNVDFNNNPDKPMPMDNARIEIIYPNHLKNVKQNQYVIVVASQPPRIKIKNGKFFSKFRHFLQAIEKSENSQMRYRSLTGSISQVFTVYVDLYYKANFQMTLNTLYRPNHLAPQLNTYEPHGFCPLVPKPVKSLKSTTFLKPFQLLVWISILISIITCMILWRLSGSSTSMWFIPFFFWAFAQGQSINFDTNKKILIVVLQILVFMLLILGNAYQGVITSFMIEPDQPETLKSFDELLTSDYKILISSYENLILKDHSGYQTAVENGKVLFPGSAEKFINLTEMYNKDTAALITCELANALASTDEGSNFYVINENMFLSFTQLQVTFLNKYLKKWQLIMDWCFEAGLPQAWEKFENDEKIFKPVEENLNGILKFEDILIAFVLATIGSVLAFLALLGEIFWHDFATPYLKRRKDLRENREDETDRKISTNKKRFRKISTNIKRFRKIQVRPINSEDGIELN